MKSIMLTCAVALISALNANANLGETKGQSINHYGRIISTNERGISMWNVKGYWIAEWFNENGYAESIWYYKKSGGISQRESDAFQHVNLPSTALDQGWLEQELRAVPDQNSRVWLTPDGVWYFESGS